MDTSHADICMTVGITLLYQAQPPTWVALTDAVVPNQIHKLFAV